MSEAACAPRQSSCGVRRQQARGWD